MLFPPSPKTSLGEWNSPELQHTHISHWNLQASVVLTFWRGETAFLSSSSGSNRVSAGGLSHTQTTGLSEPLRHHLNTEPAARARPSADQEGERRLRAEGADREWIPSQQRCDMLGYCFSFNVKTPSISLIRPVLVLHGNHARRIYLYT